MLPVQGDVGSGYKKEQSVEWEFTRLECQIYTPRLDYVTRSLQSEDIQHHIQGYTFNFRKRLYMVTGVRIARDSRKTERFSHSIGAHTKAGLDMTAFGVPITAGVDPSFEKDRYGAHSFQNASDFVYAYRLAEIYYGKHLSVTPYMRGNTFASDLHSIGDNEKFEFDIDEEDAGGALEPGGIIVEGIGDEDYDGDVELQKFSSEKEDYYLPRGCETDGTSMLQPNF
ncbi:hypothetical protein CMQ_8184 [Grosmannia clavigera kw1407]|uniref:Uncharacterized protein n=1 Tax=Grosmannia clavigera (strain kw1407 / UAMH 11150) TaxID=655863 RepID=F0XKV8_GROCL|nr:uncharacterized protein CMQ_8184 [Grosmannia clavigera kw1407]EFX01718.1 hypothetical protein CMQ_8184 [Grosmannia clavigera kw1407]